LVCELIVQSPRRSTICSRRAERFWAAEKGNGKEKENDEGEGDATERMARINAAVAEKLAGQHTLSLSSVFAWLVDR
jgi:hypothetical protein